jgi:hypothetical protein
MGGTRMPGVELRERGISHDATKPRFVMQRDTKTRAGIAALVYTMTNAVMFGAALITVLSVPYFRDHAAIGISAAVVASLIVAAPIAWLIAPRLRARTSRQPRVLHARVRRGR